LACFAIVVYEFELVLARVVFTNDVPVLPEFYSTIRKSVG
jgi:hypothetical protein